MEARLLERDPRVAATHPLRRLEPAALAATRAAALACQRWAGRGRGKAADRAATEAMRASLSRAPGIGTVVIGEGAKDEAPMLFDGERLGAGNGPQFDIALDPLECTQLCAKGLPRALATIALGKAKEQLNVVVLDKPRHRELIERIHLAGARVISPPDGDVGGALAALLPEAGADLLMGVGGTPEGGMTACAARALGGFMQGRLAPQRDDERQAVAAAGLSTERTYELDDLVGGDSLFVATGVTGGALVRRPWHKGGHPYTDSIVIAAGSVRRVVEAQLDTKEWA